MSYRKYALCGLWWALGVTGGSWVLFLNIEPTLSDSTPWFSFISIIGTLIFVPGALLARWVFDEPGMRVVIGSSFFVNSVNGVLIGLLVRSIKGRFGASISIKNA